MNLNVLWRPVESSWTLLPGSNARRGPKAGFANGVPHGGRLAAAVGAAVHTTHGVVLGYFPKPLWVLQRVIHEAFELIVLDRVRCCWRSFVNSIQNCKEVTIDIWPGSLWRLFFNQKQNYAKICKIYITAVKMVKYKNWFIVTLCFVSVYSKFRHGFNERKLPSSIYRIYRRQYKC